MVGKIVAEEYDICLASLTIKPWRAKVIHFLPPLGEETFGFYVQAANDNGMSWDVFVQPFHGNLWFSMLLFSAICSTLLLITISLLKEEASVRHFLKNLAHLEIFFIASYFGKAIKISSTGKKFNLFYKATLFSISASGLIIFIAYKASLTSELSVRNIKLPFNSIDGLAAAKNMKLISNGLFMKMYKE